MAQIEQTKVNHRMLLFNKRLFEQLSKSKENDLPAFQARFNFTDVRYTRERLKKAKVFLVKYVDGNTLIFGLQNRFSVLT